MAEALQGSGEPSAGTRVKASQVRTAVPPPPPKRHATARPRPPAAICCCASTTERIRRSQEESLGQGSKAQGIGLWPLGCACPSPGE